MDKYGIEEAGRQFSSEVIDWFRRFVREAEPDHYICCNDDDDARLCVRLLFYAGARPFEENMENDWTSRFLLGERGNARYIFVKIDPFHVPPGYIDGYKNYPSAEDKFDLTDFRSIISMDDPESESDINVGSDELSLFLGVC